MLFCVQSHGKDFIFFKTLVEANSFEECAAKVENQIPGITSISVENEYIIFKELTFA